MRWFVPASLLLLSSLACMGGDATDGEGDPAEDVDEDEDGDEDEDEDEDEDAPSRGKRKASPDCTVGMIGVLAGVPGYGGDEAEAPVELLKLPTKDGRVMAEITAKGMAPPDKPPFCSGTGDEACVSIPLALEQRGLPVYEVSDNERFALVGLGRGGNALDEAVCRRRGWVKLDAPIEVKMVADLVPGAMAYLRPQVSTELYDAPDGDAGDTVAAKGEELPLAVKSVKKEGEHWWIEVDVLDGSTCEGGTPEVVSSGWMPLYDDADRLQVWFWTDC